MRCFMEAVPSHMVTTSSALRRRSPLIDQVDIQLFSHVGVAGDWKVSYFSLEHSAVTCGAV